MLWPNLFFFGLKFYRPKSKVFSFVSDDVDEPQTKENNYFQTKIQFKPQHWVHTAVDPDSCKILKKVFFLLGGGKG